MSEQRYKFGQPVWAKWRTGIETEAIYLESHGVDHWLAVRLEDGYIDTGIFLAGNVRPRTETPDLAAEVDALPRCCVYSPAVAAGDVRNTA